MSRSPIVLVAVLGGIALTGCASAERSVARMNEPGRCTSVPAPGGGSTLSCAVWSRTTTTTTTKTTSATGETSTTVERTTTGD